MLVVRRGCAPPPDGHAPWSGAKGLRERRDGEDRTIFAGHGLQHVQALRGIGAQDEPVALPNRAAFVRATAVVEGEETARIEWHVDDLALQRDEERGDRGVGDEVVVTHRLDRVAREPRFDIAILPDFDDGAGVRPYLLLETERDRETARGTEARQEL